MIYIIISVIKGHCKAKIKKSWRKQNIFGKVLEKISGPWSPWKLLFKISLWVPQKCHTFNWLQYFCHEWLPIEFNMFEKLFHILQLLPYVCYVLVHLVFYLFHKGFHILCDNFLYGLHHWVLYEGSSAFDFYDISCDYWSPWRSLEPLDFIKDVWYLTIFHNEAKEFFFFNFFFMYYIILKPFPHMGVFTQGGEWLFKNGTIFLRWD